jgi:hypothetical protein
VKQCLQDVAAIYDSAECHRSLGEYEPHQYVDAYLGIMLSSIGSRPIPFCIFSGLAVASIATTSNPLLINLLDHPDIFLSKYSSIFSKVKWVAHSSVFIQNEDVSLVDRVSLSLLDAVNSTLPVINDDINQSCYKTQIQMRSTEFYIVAI